MVGKEVKNKTCVRKKYSKDVSNKTNCMQEDTLTKHGMEGNMEEDQQKYPDKCVQAFYKTVTNLSRVQ
jgi:hypothetical protein